MPCSKIWFVWNRTDSFIFFKEFNLQKLFLIDIYPIHIHNKTWMILLEKDCFHCSLWRDFLFPDKVLWIDGFINLTDDFPFVAHFILGGKIYIHLGLYVSARKTERFLVMQSQPTHRIKSIQPKYSPASFLNVIIIVSIWSFMEIVAMRTCVCVQHDMMVPFPKRLREHELLIMLSIDTFMNWIKSSWHSVHICKRFAASI